MGCLVIAHSTMVFDLECVGSELGEIFVQVLGLLIEALGGIVQGVCLSYGGFEPMIEA